MYHIRFCRKSKQITNYYPSIKFKNSNIINKERKQNHVEVWLRKKLISLFQGAIILLGWKGAVMDHNFVNTKTVENSNTQYLEVDRDKQKRIGATVINYWF